MAIIHVAECDIVFACEVGQIAESHATDSNASDAQFASVRIDSGVDALTCDCGSDCGLQKRPA